MGRQVSFKKATKRMAKLKLAVNGPAGSGKTLSSLLLAKGLVDGLEPRKEKHADGSVKARVAVIDSENASACLYINHQKLGGLEFDIDEMDPPYTAQKYLASIKAAIAGGYDVLIIDSYSHVWAGEGGLLDQKSAKDSRGGNSFTNWNEITKLHEQIKSLVLFSDIHIIATMRTKQEYILQANDKGKQEPKRVGLAPVQREGMEYEFTVVFDIDISHQFLVSKDRTSLFDGYVGTIDETVSHKLLAWLGDADRTPRELPKADVAAPPQQPNAATKPATKPPAATDTAAPPQTKPTTETKPAKPTWGDHVVQLHSQTLHNKNSKIAKSRTSKPPTIGLSRESSLGKPPTFSANSIGLPLRI
jgi:hypothetical protein